MNSMDTETLDSLMKAISKLFNKARTTLAATPDTFPPELLKPVEVSVSKLLDAIEETRKQPSPEKYEAVAEAAEQLKLTSKATFTPLNPGLLKAQVAAIDAGADANAASILRHTSGTYRQGLEGYADMILEICEHEIPPSQPGRSR